MPNTNTGKEITLQEYYPEIAAQIDQKNLVNKYLLSADVKEKACVQALLSTGSVPLACAHLQQMKEMHNNNVAYMLANYYGDHYNKNIRSILRIDSETDYSDSEFHALLKAHLLNMCP